MNPFLTNKEFDLRVISFYKRSYNGSAQNLKETTEKYLQEEQKKVNVYKIGSSTQYTTFLFGLSKPGRDLFLYIVANIAEERDIIVLNCEKICKIIGIARNTYYSAIEDLKENSVITTYKRSEYWVNPFMIFRGDRISYYSEQCPDCIQVVAKLTVGESLTDKN